MTVWINNPFDFLPGEGARLQRYGLLAQAFAEAGHRVIWWSSDWSHAEKRRREVLKFESSKVLKLGEKCGNAGMRECANERNNTNIEHSTSNIHLRQGYGGQVEHPIGEIEIRLIKTMAYEQNVGVRRLLSHWLYAKRWEREALRCEPADRPDLIICSAPPLSTGWVMRGLCKHFACKGVVDVMDLWPETFERVAPAWLLWPLRWMAKRVYQGADAISAVGDSYLNVVKGYLGTPRQGEAVPKLTPRQGEPPARAGQSLGETKPMYRCYHGIEIGQCANARMEPPARAGQSLSLTPRQGEAVPGAEGPLRLVYVGNMGRGYDLETLVRAVKELAEEGVAIALDLAGGGEQETALKRLAHATPVIMFHGVVRGDALRALLEQADAGVVPMFPSTHVAVPYKLADYAAAGLPVINSLRGETSALLEQYACGWQYEAGSVASLKQALRAACELKLRDGGAFDARRSKAQQLAEECFDAARIYPAFVAFLLLLLPLSGSNGVVKSNAVIVTTQWSQWGD